MLEGTRRSTSAILGAFLLFLVTTASGCYAGLAGLVVGIIEASGGAGESTNQPPLQPVILGARRLDRSHVLVEYSLANDNAGPLAVEVKWQAIEGAGAPPPLTTLAPAKEVPDAVPGPDGGSWKSDGTEDLAVDANVAKTFRFVWEARSDLAGALPGQTVALARIEITAFEGSLESKTGASDLFWAGNKPPEVSCSGPTLCVPESATGFLPIDVRLSDSTADLVLLEADFHDPCAGTSGKIEFRGVPAGRQLTSSAGGEDYTFFWDTGADVPGLCEGVTIEITPRDEFERGDTLTLGPLRVDNNRDPLVQLVGVAGSPDQAFAIPIRFVVTDEEKDPVSVILQWAREGEDFPSMVDLLPRLERDPSFLRDFLLSPEDSFQRLRKDLHLLSEAQLLSTGLVAPSGGLPLDRVRLPDLVRQGLIFRPPSRDGPRDLGRGPFTEEEKSDVFVLGRRIRFVEASSGLDVERRIIGFDPRDSTVTLSEPLEAALPSGTRYDLHANGLPWQLSSSAEGIVHFLVWDSLADLLEEGVPLDSTIRLGAFGIDRYQAGPPDPVGSTFQIEDRYLVQGTTLAGEEVPSAVALGDMNGDGWTDVVISSSGPPGRLRTFFRGSLGDLAPFNSQEKDLPGAPGGIAIGDVNGDGLQDVLVTLQLLNTLRIYAQTADHSLEELPPLAVGGGPTAVAVGDLDADPGGLKDLAVANFEANTLTVYLQRTGGDGNRLERSSPDLKTASGPQAIAIGDVNGDGKDDLVVACYKVGSGRGAVNVFFQKPGGGLAPDPLRLVAGDKPVAVSIGDVDGRNGNDVLVANQGSDEVGIFYQGAGGELPATPLALKTGPSPRSVAVWDLNRDGRLDVLVLSLTSSTMGVFLQKADGTLPALPSQELAQPARSTQMALGPANGLIDSIQIATIAEKSKSVEVHDQSLPGSISLLPSQVLPTSRQTGAGPVSIALGDLNGDGRADVAVANRESSTVSLFHQDIVGRIVKVEEELEPGIAPRSVAVGDLDGDGRNDLAVTAPSSGRVSIYRQDRSGAFLNREDLPFDGNPWSAAVTDLDGDGRIDLAVAIPATNRVSIFHREGEGWVPGQDLRPETGPIFVVAGDLDLDGTTDLVVANSDPVSADTLSVYLADERGVLGKSYDLDLGPDPSPVYVALGDVDGDGLPELAVANQKGNEALLFFQTVPGRFGAVSTALSTSNHNNSVVIGDVNGDGRNDVLVATTPVDLAVFFNPARTPRLVQERIPTPEVPTAIALGDLNGDGRTDLFVLLGNSTLNVYLAR
jgi:hypothetical protein